MDGMVQPTEMQKFANFTLQIFLPPNPVQNLDNSLTAAQDTGRDLFLASPGEDVLDELREIASDTDFEEEELRESVGLALVGHASRRYQ